MDVTVRALVLVADKATLIAYEDFPLSLNAYAGFQPAPCSLGDKRGALRRLLGWESHITVGMRLECLKLRT